MVWMDARRHIHVYADILILELGVPQRVHKPRPRRSSHAHAGLEATRGDRYFVADAQFRRLSVDGPNLWILNNLRGVVRQQRIGRKTRQGYRVVASIQVTEVL